MVAIVLVKLTGWLVLDPLIAIAVAINISLTGLNLFRETASGLMDHSLPEAELQSLEAYLKQRSGNGIDFHALRTRVAGSRRFISCTYSCQGMERQRRARLLRDHRTGDRCDGG